MDKEDDFQKEINENLKKQIKFTKRKDYTKASYYETNKNFFIDGDPFKFLSSMQKLRKQEYGRLCTALNNLNEKRKDESLKIIEEKSKLIEGLLKKDLCELTLKEAKLIGKEKEWLKKIHEVLRFCYHKLPIIPSRGINYFEEYRIQNEIKEDEVTINFYKELYNEYKDMTYDEIKNSLNVNKKCKKSSF